MNNDLIPYEELGLTQDRFEIINKFCFYKKAVEDFESEIKDNFKKLVESGAIPVSSVDIGNIILSYRKAYTKKSIDTNKLKEDGIYEDYLKESEVKSSVSMTIKEE